MPIGGDTPHNKALDEFFGKLEEDTERKVADRNAVRGGTKLPDLSTSESKEAFLFTEISRLLGRTNKTLEEFENRVDAGDVYEGTIQGLIGMTAETNKMLDQFVKLKIHREKSEQSDTQLDKKLEHQRREGDKKLMAKGFEVGEDGKLIAETGGGGEHHYLLTASPGEITSSPLFHSLVEKVVEELPEPEKTVKTKIIEAEVVEAK